MIAGLGDINATTGMTPLTCDDLDAAGMHRNECPIKSSVAEPIMIAVGLAVLFMVFSGR